MLTFDSVKLRLEREQPLTFLEFNYMILQAYDFMELSKRHDCILQMGGSDQWGNIVNGIDLGRRVAERELFGLTTPLITTASGAKMGKTADGAVWLRPERFSPYDYWQFWRNTEDADVGRFLKLFTDLPLDEIACLETLQGSEINEAKKILASAATALLHGAPAAQEAAATAEQTFEAGVTADGLPTIRVPKVNSIQGLPSSLLSRAGSLANPTARTAPYPGAAARGSTMFRFQKRRWKSGLDAVNSDGVIKLSAGKKRRRSAGRSRCFPTRARPGPQCRAEPVDRKVRPPHQKPSLQAPDQPRRRADNRLTETCGSSSAPLTSKVAAKMPSEPPEAPGR